MRFEKYRLASKAAEVLKPEAGWRNMAYIVNQIKGQVRPEDPEGCIPLVFIDTRARLEPRDGNEISNAHQTFVVEQMEMLATETNSVVVALHHIAQVSHNIRFKDIDPLTYARGGKGASAAARVNLALAHAHDNVVGLKCHSNDQPRRPPVYFETCPAGKRGIVYFRVLPPDEAGELEEKVEADQKQARKKRAQESQPSTLAVYGAIHERGPGPHSTADVKRLIGRLWPNPSTGNPRGHESPAVRKLAHECFERWESSGWITWTGGGNNRKLTPVKDPPSQCADLEEMAEALDG
jgi:hypothetical protein